MKLVVHNPVWLSWQQGTRKFQVLNRLQQLIDLFIQYTYLNNKFIISLTIYVYLNPLSQAPDLGQLTLIIRKCMSIINIIILVIVYQLDSQKGS
ncbi:hypothetical protein FGO68_gene12410 [Halteria grandinella]|uniref:Uncharacterized protein n=1 Tax=Halteria grandinella TaxID=5974 RepID=A0A8J8T4Z7_HALGN|nr:hypothetical protein FGO68_gene12410 [Halteria grandinella]